ncbi:hypothetical protein CIPAW_07G150500 [Carya illinoinensis]|uniref:Uncharacterized protein n=1 Tax=Carya illinoinensis TaxID=32201 RepID=A0A8T1Q593_CARIL|nr:hypothetical protein CIPAW_07G150500 [Carya illinoinensis]
MQARKTTVCGGTGRQKENPFFLVRFSIEGINVIRYARKRIYTTKLNYHLHSPAAYRSWFSLNIYMAAIFLSLPRCSSFSNNLVSEMNGLVSIFKYLIMLQLVPRMNRMNECNNVLPIHCLTEQLANAFHINDAHCRVIAMVVHQWHGTHLRFLRRRRG